MNIDELKTEIVRASGSRQALADAPEFGSYYANDTQIMTTPWDFTLTFGIIAGVDTEKKQALVQRVAEVRMSPQHIKRLVEVLGQQIRNYEASIGFIPQPILDDAKP